jgi:hypothetical protein
MDVDIRKHVLQLRFDDGQEETSTETMDLGQNSKGEIVKVKVNRDDSKNIISVKIQHL